MVLPYFFVGWVVIMLALLARIDYQKKILPNTLTLPLLLGGLLFNGFSFIRFCSPSAACCGAVMGYLLLWLVNAIHYRIVKLDGIGGGDLKLLAAIGAVLGWTWVVPIVFCAAVLVLITHRKYLLKTLTVSTGIAFGPYLCVVTFMVILNQMIRFYPNLS